MLTNDDIALLQQALNVYESTSVSSAISPLAFDALRDKLVAMIQPDVPTTPLTHCAKCGRAYGDPANATCDMQPCFFN